MQKRWLLSLFLLFTLFVVLGLIIHPASLAAYYFMTMSMSVVSFIYYFVVVNAQQKANNKMLSANLAAIILKFSLSLLIVIIYAISFKPIQQFDFVYYFAAYFLYSIVNYYYSYRYKNQ